jgi:uncharacterized membrane protein
MVNIFESISFSITFGVASVIDEEIKIMMSLSAVSVSFYFFKLEKLISNYLLSAPPSRLTQSTNFS